jgi:hypothetical protein
MSTRFEIAYGVAQITSSMLVYRPAEYSFDMEPAPAKNFTSILIDDLNMEVDETGKVISIWGLCPHTRWTEATLIPLLSKTGVLLVVSDRPLLRGVSVRLNRVKYLPTYVDRDSGWVRIKAEPPPTASVMVFPGVIVEIGDQGQFSSLWLQPRRGINRRKGDLTTHECVQS